MDEVTEWMARGIRRMRGGKMYEAQFGARMKGQGILAGQIHSLFKVARRKARIPERGFDLSTAAFRRVEKDQMELF